MNIALYAMKLDREFWGVLEGPWGSDTWMSWRRDWAQRVSPVLFLFTLQKSLTLFIADMITVRSSFVNMCKALHTRLSMVCLKVEGLPCCMSSRQQKLT